MARHLLVSSALLVLFVSTLSSPQASDKENQEGVVVEDRSIAKAVTGLEAGLYQDPLP